MENVLPRVRWQVRKRRSGNLLEHLCQVRGFDAASLRPDYALHLHDPFLLPDMELACQLIAEAKKESWHVTVFGDYDADGTPASAVLSILLKHIGIPHQVVLPTRQSGYGLKKEIVKEISQKSQLLITVDTGISSIDEIAEAKKLGLKVIVLDHHLPQNKVPNADALIDPHLPTSTYPFPHLCGCALAYKLVCALSRDFPEITEGFRKWLLDLVAISTVADMMPLVGENRALVHYGLMVLRQNRRPGLRSLLAQAGVDTDNISATTLGFVIGPRLNASGRLGDNRPAYELLVTENEAEAEKLAQAVEEANKLRQSLVEEILLEAEALLFKENDPEDLIFTLHKEGWPSGVVGLVAGKLAQQYCRPVVVGALQEGRITASARSTDRYSIIEGLASVSKLLLTYGGHKQAAGLSMEGGRWEDFSRHLKNHGADVLTKDDICKLYLADALLGEADLSLNVADALDHLQPFGLGNHKPLLILPTAVIEQVRYIGSRQNHLKMRLLSHGKTVDAIGFNLAARYKNDPIVDGQFLGYLENNRWQGRETLQFQVVDYQDRSSTIETI